MKHSQQQTVFRRIVSSRFFLIGVFCIGVSIAIGVGRAYFQHYQLKKEIQTLQQEINALSQKKLKSMEILSYVMSPVFAEEKARVELNMKKPGEQVAIVQEPPQLGEPQKELADTRQRQGNPIQWWYYFLTPSYDRGANNDDEGRP